MVCDEPLRNDVCWNPKCKLMAIHQVKVEPPLREPKDTESRTEHTESNQDQNNIIRSQFGHKPKPLSLIGLARCGAEASGESFLMMGFSRRPSDEEIRLLRQVINLFLLARSIED
jgi:hypothetical protein